MSETERETTADKAAAASIRFWLRRCNGAEPGCLVDEQGAIASTSLPGITDVRGSLETGRSWEVPELRRKFTLTPLTDEQAAAWIRARRGTAE
jgi:hypothetical protein